MTSTKLKSSRMKPSTMKPSKIKPRINVMGIGFDPVTQTEIELRLQQAIARHLHQKQSFVYLKPYVEFYNSQDNQPPPEVKQLLQTADLVVADGVAIQWASAYLADQNPSFWHWVWSWLIGIRRQNWLTQIIPERGAGVDTTTKLLNTCQKNNWRIAVLGGPVDNDATLTALRKIWPKLDIAGVWSGYFDPAEEPALVKTLASQKIDILFVAMGYWKQEDFIARNRTGIAKIMIGEGGSFDYDQMGGSIKRAPDIWRQVGLEWLWRLIKQPRRIGRQMAIPRFMWSVFRASRKKSDL